MRGALVTRDAVAYLAAASLNDGARLADEIAKHVGSMPVDLVYRLGRWAGRAEHRADEIRNLACSLDRSNERSRARRRKS